MYRVYHSVDYRRGERSNASITAGTDPMPHQLGRHASSFSPTVMASPYRCYRGDHLTGSCEAETGE